MDVKLLSSQRLYSLRPKSSVKAVACQCRLQQSPTQRSKFEGSRDWASRNGAKSRCSIATKAAAVAEAGPDLDLTKMEPLGDRVLVKPEEESNTTESGLIVSSQSSGSMGLQDAIIGEVVAVGKEVDIAVKAGDNILYSKYSTSDIAVPDGDVTFVAQKSILATLS